MDLNAIWARLLRALKLEPGVFAEIGDDQKATGEGVAIAVVAGLIGGISSIGGVDGTGVPGWIFSAVIGVPIGLAIGTGIFFLLSKLFKGQGEYVQLFRGLGYSSAPNALSIVPVIGALAALVYTVVLAIRAVSEISRLSTGAAAAVVLIPVAVLFILVFILIMAVGVALMGFAAS